MRIISTLRIVQTVIGGLSILFSASQLAAAQTPAAADSTPHAARATHSFSSAKFGFEVELPAAMDNDARAQKTLDGPGAGETFHAWNFLQPPAKGSADTHWLRVTITAVMGIAVDEAGWAKQTAGILAAALQSKPQREVLENTVRWRPDTAEFRLGLRDPSNKYSEFATMRCLGSRKERQRAIIVCVQTGTPTADGLASVRESLVLTPQQVPASK